MKELKFKVRDRIKITGTHIIGVVTEVNPSMAKPYVVAFGDALINTYASHGLNFELATGEETFFIIWNPTYPKSPSVQFSTREDVDKRAKSMALQHGEKFYVLEAKGFFEGVVEPRAPGCNWICPFCKSGGNDFGDVAHHDKTCFSRENKVSVTTGTVGS